MQLDANQSEAFVRLLTRYQPRVYLFILSLLPNRSDADEVLQETNVVLWQRFGEFEPGSNFRAWAFQIAYFKVQQFLERQQRSPLRFSDEFLEKIAATAGARPDDFDPRQAALADCLGQLPAQDRALIEARYQSGSSVASMASQHGRSSQAIYKAVQRIRRRLHNCVCRKLSLEAGQ